VKNKFTILGCGSSLGSPWITDYWGNCDKKNKKNLRSRCCAHFQYKDISALIDTSPDIKTQFKHTNMQIKHLAILNYDLFSGKIKKKLIFMVAERQLMN
jgi:phosphoribosyl 1,2-cyclic phosphodiesterase